MSLPPSAGRPDRSMTLPGDIRPWSDRPVRPLRVLMSSYSCFPDQGSEPHQGWQWVRGMAAIGHEVTVLTTTLGRERIKERLDRDNLRLDIRYVPFRLTAPLVRVTPPFLATYSHYRTWQRDSYALAKKLHAVHPFDLIHHVSYSTILLGSPVSGLGIPFVYGPLGGGQSTAAVLSPWFGASGWRFERLRNALVKCTCSIPGSRAAVRRADVVLATNRDTARLAKSLGGARIEMMIDTGVDSSVIADVPAGSGHGNQLLWVGRPLARKGLGLALEAFQLARISRPNLRLWIAGVSAADLETQFGGVPDHVDPLGWVPTVELAQLYRKSDAFLFTSLRDSLGSQVVEAMSAGLPVIGLDHNGFADWVPSGAGRKITLAGASELVGSFADAIVEMLGDEQTRLTAGCAALEAVHGWSMEYRCRRMAELYEEVLGLEAIPFS